MQEDNKKIEKKTWWVSPTKNKYIFGLYHHHIHTHTHKHQWYSLLFLLFFVIFNENVWLDAHSSVSYFYHYWILFFSKYHNWHTHTHTHRHKTCPWTLNNKSFNILVGWSVDYFGSKSNRLIFVVVVVIIRILVLYDDNDDDKKKFIHKHTSLIGHGE